MKHLRDDQACGHFPISNHGRLCSYLVLSEPRTNQAPTSKNMGGPSTVQADDGRKEQSVQCMGPECLRWVKLEPPPWGPHVRFRRVQTLVREGSPFNSQFCLALIGLPVIYACSSRNRSEAAGPAELASTVTTFGSSGMQMAESDAHINFDLPATLRKWPSLHNERLQGGQKRILGVRGYSRRMHKRVQGEA